MREILFRGKLKNSGEWVYGNLFNPDKADTPTQICIGTYIEKTCYEIDPETVGEFTGVADKNGKKIFEGDIMRNAGNVVGFCGGNFCINGDSPLSYWTETEVVGNIYDNPELLEGSVENG